MVARAAGYGVPIGGTAMTVQVNKEELLGNTPAPPPVDNVTIPTADWLLDLFPSAVEAGNLVSINGDIYIYGLGSSVVMTAVVMTITIPTTLITFYFDMRKRRRERKEKTG